MMRRITSLAVLAVLLLGTAPITAHEQFRIVGTVVKFKDLLLEVKSRTGEPFAIKLQESTLVQREKKRVPQTELRAGRSVVVDIMADSLYDEDPFVVSVTLVPPIAPQTAR
jgi:hypothetical protein